LRPTQSLSGEVLSSSIQMLRGNGQSQGRLSFTPVVQREHCWIPNMPSTFVEQPELLVDTHVHTHYSDGIASVPRIERFCRDRGFGVAITDHNEIRGATSIYERERIPVIPAIEVGTEEGVDLLIYFPKAELLEEFFKEAIEPFLRSRYMSRSWVQSIDCLRIAREMDAYVSLAHPFALGRKSLDFQHGRRGSPFVDSVLKGVDALELHNGGVHRQANRKARKFAATAGKRLTVGSDSHRLGTSGSNGTYLPASANPTSSALFESFRTFNDLRFKVKGSASVATLPLLGLVALKHTHRFMRARRPKKRVYTH
jgi:predicted metal-dependent phosphoesterase TrpH